MLVDTLFSTYIKYRLKRIEVYRDFPRVCQEKVFQYIIRSGQRTNFGKVHGFGQVTDYTKFKENVPLQDYDSLEPYILQAIHGAKDVLWPGYTKWFAKSSGTTGGRIKTLPVTSDSLENNHYSGGKDLLACYHDHQPHRKLYSKKHLILGGSNSIQNIDQGAIVADLSAIIIDNLPFWTEFRRVPEKEIVLHSNWEEKLVRMAEASIKEDVAILAGVPSWISTFAKIVLEKSQKQSLIEVWPHLELYIHGGMNFEPYRQKLNELIGYSEMNFLESYNASEGYFGLQDQANSNELLLLTDAQIFYEFIPMEHFQGLNSKVVHDLNDIVLQKEYAVVISTSAGLWRYIIGDTITFTSIEPYRFIISGRTAQYVNAFGEKAVVMHFEKAIAQWINAYELKVNNYTVAPYFEFSSGIGGHEWIIEFDREQKLDAEMVQELDKIMCSINSDYETKRANNLNMLPLKITMVEPGTFDRWMKMNGKFGGQHKIPRIQNHRNLAEEILALTHA
jgi:hypothetical protein